MNWIDTDDSTTITRFRYAMASRVLTIQFRTGDSYDYFDVPFEVFEALRATRSKGRYVSLEIRDRYVYEKLLA